MPNGFGRAFCRVAAAAAAAWAAASVLSGGAAAARGAGNDPETRVADLVARTAEYVGHYQDAFAYVLADEATVQRVATGRALDAVTSRVTHGELFLTYLEPERQWTAVHDIADVDGTVVPDREDLLALLQHASIDSVAGRLFARNARYNIGSVLRNFNDPMLALLTLDPERRPRFAFSGGHAAAGGADELRTITFRERERPTLVRDTKGGPVYASGELTIDAGTGTVHRTRVAFRHDGIDAELVTEFGEDPHLGMWVPRVFREQYSANRGHPEVITVTSSYENYRRFDVTWKLR